MFRPVLNPDMLRWVSAQEWNNDELTSCYRVETFYFKERVNVGGKWCFRSDGNGGTIISVQGHIRIHTDGIPGLPAPIARVAGDMIEKFLERNSLEKLLKEKYPEKS
jgi:hypothetical protein